MKMQNSAKRGMYFNRFCLSLCGKTIYIMQTAAAKTPPVGQAQKHSAQAPRLITWESFQKRYLHREDGHTYEWVRGVVERTQNTMDSTQLYIQRNLISHFRVLLFQQQVSGELLAEADLLFFKNLHRRPDLAWLTNQQINHLAQKGAIEIPAFIIEVISTNDAAQRIVEKMEDYRASGVRVVWHIFPIQQQVHVYSGDRLEHMRVCYGDSICSAAPVLPDYAFPARAVFDKGM